MFKDNIFKKKCSIKLSPERAMRRNIIYDNIIDKYIFRILLIILYYSISFKYIIIYEIDEKYKYKYDVFFTLY